MGALERTVAPEPIAGTERAFEVKLGALGGVELRPTRLFLWRGGARDASERLVSLGARPVGLGYERRESTIRVGAVELRSRGNPLLTLAMAGTIALRRLVEDEPAAPGRPRT